MLSFQHAARVLTLSLAASGALVSFAAPLRAAEVRLLSSAGIKPVIDAVKPQFERSTGHTLTVKYVLTPQVAVHAEQGEPFDVAITIPAHIVKLDNSNVVAAGTGTNIARFDLGIGVRAGAAKPDISTQDALKRALLAAKSIAYVGGGATGPMVTAMLDQLGITEEVKAKLKTGSVEGSQAAVANGEAEMMVLPVPLIKEAKGVELAGALPPPFQNSITMAAGIGSKANDRAAAQALITFLTSNATDSAIATSGYQRASAAPAASTTRQ